MPKLNIINPEKNDDVCCAACNSKVCGYEEEPPHKDDRDEAMCCDCFNEDESMYKEPCGECGMVLGIDIPIMCYKAHHGCEKTLCNDCYWDCEYYYTDVNEDNREEIERFIEDNHPMEECDVCGYEDGAWCQSNGCEKGQRRLEYYLEEGIIKELKKD